MSCSTSWSLYRSRSWSRCFHVYVFLCLGLGISFDMSRSRPFLSLRCREVGCRERNKESVRGGEGKTNIMCRIEGQ
jgi:hypothetical protein